ncbi:MAG: AMP-binding protein [bacterium]
MPVLPDQYQVDSSSSWFRPASGWPDEVSKNIDFPRTSLGQFLDDAAARWKNAPAAWFQGSEMTYGAWKRHADALGAALSKQDVGKGDVIALLLPNSFQYLISYYAVTKIGAIVSGINPADKPNEILHHLQVIGATGLIVLDELYEPLVAPIRNKSELRLIIGTNLGDVLPGPKQFFGKLLGKLRQGPLPRDALRFKALLRTPGPLPAVDIDVEQDTATYIMTGGTTGVPKAAELTHFNCVSNALQCRAWLFKVSAGTGNVGVLPLFHSFGMTAVMNASVAFGGKQILFSRPPPMAELVELLARMTLPKGAAFCGAEILFQRMAEVPGIAASGLASKITLCISGAGPLHRSVQEKFERATNARLVEGYGLTEASPVVSAGPFWPKGERRHGTVGLPMPGTEWRIVHRSDPTRDRGVGSGPEDSKHIGEIAVAGPQVMKGYLNQPDETAETIVVRDGKRWLLTGDIGYLDATGRVTILERKKQLIKYKGYSVFPREVEDLVCRNEHVAEVAVAGLPSEETGETIKAWVVLKPESVGQITEEELQAWCRENMTHYKCPEVIEFREELPKSPVRKRRRRKLLVNDPVWKAAQSKD